MRVRRDVRKAKFYTDKGLLERDPLKVHGMVHKWVQRFVEGEEKVGWTTIGKPFVQRLTIVDEGDVGPSRNFPHGGIWHPSMMKKDFTISSSHPFVREGKDIYMIWAEMWQPFVPIKQEVPDEVIEKYGLPKGGILI